jgi:nitroreductase
MQRSKRNIALGFALVAAAIEGIDSSPMEGFDAKALDAILNLNTLGLRSTTIMPLGFRDAANDWLVNLKKVRRPKEKFVRFIG